VNDDARLLDELLDAVAALAKKPKAMMVEHAAFGRLRGTLRERENALRTIAEWDDISKMTDLPSPQHIARQALRGGGMVSTPSEDPKGDR
jgi:hypothetical protein